MRLGGATGNYESRELFFFYGKGNENHQLRTGFFVHYRIISAGMKVEFVRDRMIYSSDWSLV